MAVRDFDRPAVLRYTQFFMPDCQFSEDQFEENLLAELRDFYGARLPHFKPSRLIEPNLGFDFGVATDFWPGKPGVYFNDRRIQALLPIQQRAILSGSFATSFIQCKRPYYLTRGVGQLRRHFDEWGEPVFRFEVDEDQNRKLAEVERLLAREAVVRYAAPCFWEVVKSDQLAFSCRTVYETHFVSPSRVAGHHYYTYLSPHRPGIAFSEPEEVRPEPIIFSLITQLAQSRVQPMAIYIATLWNGLSKAVNESGYKLDVEGYFEMAGKLIPEGEFIPLDPFNLIPEMPPMSFYPDPKEAPTVRSFVAAVVGIERIARDLSASVRLFTWMR